MIDRRRFISLIPSACIASTGLLTMRGARAAEFTFKVASNAPASHPLNLRLAEAAEQIKADTKGRFDLQVYPSDQLGSMTDVLSQLRSGAVDFYALSGSVLSSLVPACAISGIGFAFKDYEAVWKAMDGGLGAFIRAEIAKTRSIFAFEKTFDNGFRQITTSTRPVVTPKDLEGLKIRVPPSQIFSSLFKGLGATPTTINPNEMYSALQTKLVDGQENSLGVIAAFKLQEVQKYCAVTNHMWDGFWLLANRSNFDGLPEDVRGKIRERLNAAAVAQRADTAKLNVEARAQLVEKGMQFTNANPEDFRAKLRASGFYSEWKAKMPASGWSQLEAVVGPL